jgi:hypothetical protein
LTLEKPILTAILKEMIFGIYSYRQKQRLLTSTAYGDIEIALNQYHQSQVAIFIIGL